MKITKTKDKLIKKTRKEKLKGKNIFSTLLKTALSVIFTVGLIAAFLFDSSFQKTGVREGDIALRDIYSPVTFTYRGSVNEEETQNRRNEALSEVNEVYKINPEVAKEADAAISDYFKKGNSQQFWNNYR